MTPQEQAAVDHLRDICTVAYTATGAGLSDSISALRDLRKGIDRRDEHLAELRDGIRRALTAIQLGTPKAAFGTEEILTELLEGSDA